MPSITRCHWVGNCPLYIEYHDKEWGKAQFDSLKLFEQLCLEGQQAGLSWITVLKKRKAYRQAFFNFDPVKIAVMNEQDIERCMQNLELIRHRAKLESIVTNARAYLLLEQSGVSFSHFIWQFVNFKPQLNNVPNSTSIASKTATSKAMSKALKKYGFRFIGETTCYAFMQAMGLVNDHLNCCYYK